MQRRKKLQEAGIKEIKDTSNLLSKQRKTFGSDQYDDENSSNYKSSKTNFRNSKLGLSNKQLALSIEKGLIYTD